MHCTFVGSAVGQILGLPCACLGPGCVLLLPKVAPNAWHLQRTSGPANKLPESRRAEFSSRQLMSGESVFAASNRGSDMGKPPTEGWLLVMGLLGPHSLETEGCLLPRDAQSRRGAAVCVPHSLGDFQSGAFSTTMLHQQPFIQIWSGPLPPGLSAHPNTFSAGSFRLCP